MISNNYDKNIYRTRQRWLHLTNDSIESDVIDIMISSPLSWAEQMIFSMHQTGAQIDNATTHLLFRSFV